MRNLLRQIKPSEFKNALVILEEDKYQARKLLCTANSDLKAGGEENEKDDKNLQRLLIILGAVIVVAVGVYFWQIAKQAPSSQLQEAKNEKTDWKIYVNTAYGYSIKYPPSWYLYSNDPKDIRIQPEKEEGEQENKIPGSNASAIEIRVLDNSRSLPLKDWIDNKYKDAGYSYLVTPIKIGKLEGLKFVQTEESLGQGQPIVYFTKNDKIYELDSNLGDVFEFDKVVSTFQFIN